MMQESSLDDLLGTSELRKAPKSGPPTDLVARLRKLKVEAEKARDVFVKAEAEREAAERRVRELADECQEKFGKTPVELREWAVEERTRIEAETRKLEEIVSEHA